MSVTGLNFFFASLLAVLSGCATRVPRLQLEQGCREGLPNRCVELAEDLLQQREEQLAEPWLARGCELGHWGSCLRHASLFQWGWGVEQDWSRARNLYASACKLGVKQACQAEERIAELDAVTQCQPMALEAVGAKLREMQRLQRDSFEFCTQLRAERSAEITVKLAALIGTDGRARSVQIVENSRPDLGVAECARAQMMKWHYPCPPQEVRYIANVLFKPLE